MTFARHCNLFTKRTPPETYELIFSVVNADDRATKGDDLLNDSKYLNRQEFLQCLVRMAIAYYVQGGQLTDVSDAVGQFMTENVGPNLPAEASQSSNAFRKRFCYTERTSRVLEAHLPSLRTLYEMYSEASHDMRDRMADGKRRPCPRAASTAALISAATPPSPLPVCPCSSATI